jgi:hypothetical protein
MAPRALLRTDATESLTHALSTAITLALLQKREIALREEREAGRVLLLSIRDSSLPNFILRPRDLVSGEIPGRINARIGAN